MPKIIVAHPDKQHSFRLATAIKRKGLLFKYITTVYDKPSSLTRKVIGVLSGRDKKKAESHSCPELSDEDVVQFHEGLNLLVLLLNRIPFMHKWARVLKSKLVTSFGRKVAKYAIKCGADAVVMYDGTGLSCFKYLKEHQPSIIRILDTSTVSHDFMIDTFNRMIDLLGDATIKSEYPYLWEEGARERYNAEIALCDFFLAPSAIVKQSLLYKKKVLNDSIYNVPYGVDIEKFNIQESRKSNHPRKLLFVGQVTCRKGIHLLLKTLDSFNENEVELYVAGGLDKSSSWYSKYCDKKNVHFLGFVTRDVIANLYASVDAFILPSYAEGLALVGLEAMASGLPIICSQYSGVNDLVQNGINGFVVDVFDEEDLKKVINSIINTDDDSIIKMGREARNTAMLYSWTRYNEVALSAIESMLSRRVNK